MMSALDPFSEASGSRSSTAAFAFAFVQLGQLKACSLTLLEPLQNKLA